MVAKLDHPSRTRASSTVSKPSRIIGVKASANGKQSLKLPPLSSQLLLAWIASSDPPQETLISQCSTNMTSYSPRQALEDFDDPNQMENKIVCSKKTLME